MTALVINLFLLAGGVSLVTRELFWPPEVEDFAEPPRHERQKPPQSQDVAA